MISMKLKYLKNLNLILCVFVYSSLLSYNYVKSDVVLFINLLNYSNPSGSLYTGQCCDSYSFEENCSKLPPRCDVGIKICIDLASNYNNSADIDSCFFGSYILNGIQDLNTFNFSLNPQAALPFIFTINWEFATVPRFLLKFFALDDSSDKKLIVRNSRNKLIDYYFVDFNSNQNVIPSNGLSNDLNWIGFTSVMGQYSDSKFQTFLSFKVAMKCRNNYFTPTCRVRCVQQDSCEGGHYTCNQITGDKKCNYGFMDPTTNCIKRDAAVSLCSKSDAEFCTNNGFCYENYLRNTNISLPTCCCNRGFGGPNCSNILSCEVNPCLNGGMCIFNSTNMLGYCVCKLGYVGKYCEKKIVCPANYYGDDCSVRCIAIDNCEIHQACDYYGRLKCKDGWGSFPECNVRLINPSIDPECPISNNNLVSCLNGGSCWQNSCCCPPSFTGARCEKSVDRCTPSPCLNQGTCVSNANEFYCSCAPGFSGIYCQTLIDPCQNSTLQCSGSGICIRKPSLNGFSCSCYDGYTGQYCERQLDYCTSLPCQNNGTCVSIFKGFYCSCPLGYTGAFCEKKIDFCSSAPCVNGNCVSLVNDYVCQCNPGWQNLKTCNDDINECMRQPSPCLNNGTCFNKPGSFGCYCLPTFTGLYCETRIDYCANSLCVISQTVRCENNNDLATYSCICKSGFTGKNCDTAIDYCSSSPCVQGQSETCVNYQSRYNCICKPGFTGINCEIEENECDSKPCLNDGICVDQVDGYRCVCLNGFTGDFCQTNTNPCQINPITNTTVCGYYGTCFPQFLQPNGSNYICQCVPGYEGKNCENSVSICSMYKPCMNGATCFDVAHNNFTCICPASFTGSYCEHFINPCVQGVNLCNGGTCINKANGLNNFTCLCPTGFTGAYCQELTNPCEPNKCTLNQGFCQPLTLTNGTRTFRCICITGYTGTYCESVINQCESNPCKNNGVCQSMLGYYNCICEPNYYGNNCEYFYECSRNPCDSTGSSQCVDLAPQSTPNPFGTNYKCICRVGFTGSRCETNINECASAPCRNNATCIDLINSFVCKCADYYVGVYCENPFDFCVNNQCGVGSTCVNQPGGFKCLCAPNRTGQLCNQVLDACAIIPCRNGGSCVNLINDYSCNCLPGYTGRNCSEVVDQCALNKCYNGATCVNIPNGFYCSCRDGFTGTYCQNQIDFCQTNTNVVICLNGGTCVNGFNGFKCSCINGYTGARCDSFVDYCNATTCKNNGLCRTSIFGNVYCTCPAGFTGYYCETPVDNCISGPCMNGATCMSFAASYVCYCPFNFVGARCETKFNFCQSSPCRNNATCIDQLESFSCSCVNGFQGEICQIPPSKPCSSFPCVYGTCSDTVNGYLCTCNQGFTGPQCNNRLDYCQSGVSGLPACLNNGSCISIFNNSSASFFCICPTGFTGKRCENKINPCESFPCIRGNCTNLSNDSYKCQCQQGYTGVNCETDINECQMSDVPLCYNNATCINTQGSFFCQCLNGYSGRFCELTIDNCFSNMCKNGALCVNQVGLSYKCICIGGYTGQFCENVIDYCASAPCQNQANCISSPSRPNFFSCSCLSGFTGVLCEQTIDPCVSRPCFNNGVCISRSTANRTNSFLCACVLGFTGTLCETLLNPCLNRCQNGGTCQLVGSNDFKCVCPVGYTGITCEVVNSCLSYPCLNGGTCSILYPVGYQCICPNNYSGPNCERCVSQCSPNPCLNQGTCVENNGNFFCVCPSAYTGLKCETPTGCNPPCEFGKCIPGQNGNNVCSCIPGYTGITCNQDIKECDSNPCKNGGTCTEPFLNMYICYCQSGYTGINCDTLIKVCDSQPCLNGGVCDQVAPNQFTCKCPPGFHGKLCEYLTNECDSNPCRNGATCMDVLNGYTCHCVPGTYGINCELDVPECASQPCYNGATCTEVELNNYKCICPLRFTGYNCEIEIDPCVSNPCQNMGVCVSSQARGFQCVCKPQYTGLLCEKPVDPCIFERCIRNFTDLNINLYGLSNNFNFFSYQDCILNTWNLLNPSLSFGRNNTSFQLTNTQNALEFTENIFANKAISVIYTMNVTDLSPFTQVTIPKQQDYSRFCANVPSNNVTIYSRYWDVNVCGQITNSADVESIRLALLDLWQRKYPEINSICFCLNVDIFRDLTQYYTTGNQPVTRLFYLVYANKFKKIIEKGSISDASKIPNNDELSKSLQNAGFQSCQSQILPISFSVTLCGPLAKNKLYLIMNYLLLSWQADPASGGLGAYNRILIEIQNTQEFYSQDSTFDGKQATQINYYVYLNNQIIDQTTTATFNYDLILKGFANLAKDLVSLCRPTYPYSSSFSIVTPNKLCDSLIPSIESGLKIWYQNKFNVSNAIPISINIAEDAIEELVDDNSNLYYSIPLFIMINNQLLSPKDNQIVYGFLLEKFGSIPIRPASNQTFTVIDTNRIKTYRLALGFKFFFNYKLNLNNLNFLSDYVRQSFEKTNKSYTNSNVSIKLQQDIIFYANKNSLVANRLVAFISNSNGVLYDSRQEDNEQINVNLDALITNAGFLVNDQNQKLMLVFGQHIADFQILKYSDLFTFYLSNKYLSISPTDLIKISTWLNDEWRKYLIDQQSSILIINNELFYESGNLIIGINYFVKNINPQCVDLNAIQLDLYTSSISRLIPYLCSSDYKFYLPFLTPTKYFYSIDFIGQLDRSESYIVNLIQKALINAWASSNIGSNVEITSIANRFETRIGSLGTLVTRVFYLASQNGKPLLSYLNSAPSNSTIENQLRLLGSDLRIYQRGFSIGKALLSSLYVLQYPLSPFIRAKLENDLKQTIAQKLNLTSASNAIGNIAIDILYHELYYGQQTNKKVSRVYYSLKLFDGLIYPCELNDLYVANLNVMPNQEEFDYMIKSRSIDLLLPYGYIVANRDQLSSLIRFVWFVKNSKLISNITNIDVRIDDVSFYTSVFRPIITRIYYFITINRINVNDLSMDYIEPNITDFNSTLGTDESASYYFPNKAYRIYMKGEPSKINLNSLESSINQAWQSTNTNLNPSGSVLGQTINVTANQNLVKFYDYNNNYNFLSRVLYRALFDAYADQNDLFNFAPDLNSVRTIFDKNGIQYCDRIYCIPALFYDFYTSISYTLDEAKQLLSKLKLAWITANLRQTDLNFQNSIINDFYSIIPYTSNVNQIVYRIIYSFALKDNDKNLDSSDYIDPTDEVYNATLGSIIQRDNYTQLVTPQRLIVDTVVGIQWWMILIIILAILLLLLALALCLYALAVRRSNVKYVNIGSYSSSTMKYAPTGLKYSPSSNGTDASSSSIELDTAKRMAISSIMANPRPDGFLVTAPSAVAAANGDVRTSTTKRITSTSSSMDKRSKKKIQDISFDPSVSSYYYNHNPVTLPIYRETYIPIETVNNGTSSMRNRSRSSVCLGLDRNNLHTGDPTYTISRQFSRSANRILDPHHDCCDSINLNCPQEYEARIN